ncbi:MAG: NAD(P)/FAD-dependent oxidoreductase [Candidatus Latescibacterota bacterium]|nr:MAG: NAD(P)/FAD-dependent oxidoreductase [Candidatus Latescibacterota bacterium]
MTGTAIEKTDAVIVGCGVAGGLLAGRLAKDGYRVVVLEKRPEIGVPVRCGEAAGSREEISPFIPVDDRWVVAQINAARMYAPDETFVEKRFPGVGLMIKRDRFDQALAKQASEWGAEIRTHHEVVAVARENGRICGVAVINHNDNTRYMIEAKVTVGADGVEGCVGRLSGLTRHLKLKEIHAGLEYLLEGDGFPTDTIEIYVGRSVAPGGYVWVFPKGHRLANVGVGVLPTMAKTDTAKTYLDRFVDKHFPNAKRKALIAGGVSGTKPLKTMVDDGVLLVGEAARHNNPFSGGGIMNALEGAEEAHRVMVEALKENDLSRRSLQRYDKAWHKRNGRLIHKFALLRELFFKLEDDDMNKVISVLGKIAAAQSGKITDYTELFGAAFKTTPGVLWKARKMLW